MGIYPKNYTKEEFQNYLKNNNVNNNIINKFAEIPETINKNGNKYDLYINTTWYSIGNTYYSFELNYYCEAQIEFLFTLKVSNDVELSINNLFYELKTSNLIKQ